MSMYDRFTTRYQLQEAKIDEYVQSKETKYIYKIVNREMKLLSNGKHWYYNCVQVYPQCSIPLEVKFHGDMIELIEWGN